MEYGLAIEIKSLFPVVLSFTNTIHSWVWFVPSTMVDGKVLHIQVIIKYAKTDLFIQKSPIPYA